MKNYHTEQKQALLTFLQENADRPMTISHIATGLSGERVPGKSTVYRLMDRLVQEGAVRRFVRGNSRHFVYQIMTERCHEHLHCRCVSCGKLYHLDRSVLAHMEQMLATSGFVLDPAKTTLMGTCDGCGGQ